MSETSFSGSYGPLALIEPDDGTPFAASPRRRRTGLRTLRKLDAVADVVDDVLAEASAMRRDLTPLSTDVVWWPAPVPPVDESNGIVGLREQALFAIADIRSTLAISDAATAALVGVARNTLASWRKGDRDPYPATVRTLFEVHSVVSAAAALLGAGTAGWFHTLVGDETRLAILGSPGGPARISAELRINLFPGVGESSLPAEDEFAEDEVRDERSYLPEVFAQPIRRRRRVK